MKVLMIAMMTLGSCQIWKNPKFYKEIEDVEEEIIREELGDKEPKDEKKMPEKSKISGKK